MEHALELFNDERFVPCMAECRALLSYEELSPYYQIHCRALIAGCLDDWYEAEVCLNARPWFCRVDHIRPHSPLYHASMLLC